MSPQSRPHSIISDGAEVAFFATGHGEPAVLLIHSVNAAGSAAEVEPLRAHFATSRTVYCLELPGFGHSDRSDRVYSPRLMCDAIIRVAEDVVARIGRPLDALALSLSCEFLARAASEHPALFRSLALVSPTGFSGGKKLRAAAGTTRGKAWLYALLRGPGWGAGLYRQLTRPGVIRYFLERTWGSKNIDEALWRADILISRFAGAHFAPLYFLSAKLFSADIHDVYDRLRPPIWVCHGKRGDFTDYHQLQGFAERNNWRVTIFDTGALPYFEELQPFVREYEAFLETLSGAAAAAVGR